MNDWLEQLEPLEVWLHFLGPNIRGAHSASERLEIDSVTDFWQLLKGGQKVTSKTAI